MVCLEGAIKEVRGNRGGRRREAKGEGDGGGTDYWQKIMPGTPIYSCVPF